MILIGGGAKSRLWNEMLSHIFNMPVKVHSSPEVATFWELPLQQNSVGIFKDFATAVDPVFERQYPPDPAQHEEYERYYDIYRSIYPNIKPVYNKIAELQPRQ